MLGNCCDCIKMSPALNTIFVTWQQPTAMTSWPHLTFWSSHWYLTGTLFIKRTSRVRVVDLASEHNHLDRHASFLYVWVSRGLVFQQRVMFLCAQVVPQLLITSCDSQQPPAWWKALLPYEVYPLPLLYVGAACVFTLIIPCVDPRSLVGITSSSQPPPSPLPIIKEKNGRGSKPWTGWQLCRCCSGGCAPHKADHKLESPRFGKCPLQGTFVVWPTSGTTGAV